MSGILQNLAFFMPPDPLRPQGYQDTLRATKEKNDPEGPPPKRPGDAYIAGYALLGVVLGGIAAFFIVRPFAGDAVVMLGTAAGVIIGGLIGVFVGDAVKRHKYQGR